MKKQANSDPEEEGVDPFKHPVKNMWNEFKILPFKILPFLDKLFTLIAIPLLYYYLIIDNVKYWWYTRKH